LWFTQQKFPAVTLWQLATSRVKLTIVTSDVSLRQKPRFEAAKVLPRPRLDVLMPRLGLASVSMLTSKLRYDIIIHNFYPFIVCIYVLKTFKTKLHLCIKQRF